MQLRKNYPIIQFIRSFLYVYESINYPVKWAAAPTQSRFPFRFVYHQFVVLLITNMSFVPITVQIGSRINLNLLQFEISTTM